MTKRVVITGMGIVSPQVNKACYDLNDYWQTIVKGQSAIGEWQLPNNPECPVRYAAAIDFDRFYQDHQPLLANTPLLERRGYFGFVAAHLAYQHAELTPAMDIGITSCSGVPDVSDEEIIPLQNSDHYPKHLLEHQPKKMSGLTQANDSMVAAIASQLQLQGPMLNINGACAGAAQAIGLAYRMIQRGEVDAMLAGGADSVLNTRVMSGLFLLGATATSSLKGENLCCPFDLQRSGLVAGEGGAYLVLESEESAKARKATIYAEVLGYGSSLDAYKVTAPHPEGEGAATAMLAAMTDAKLAPQNIDYINAHGTSTPLNDKMETRVIKQLFAQSEQYPLVSSTKSIIGHWISAAAAPEAIATVLGIYHGIVPPTINLSTPDPECDLDYVPQARSQAIRYALSNSFGFGGINACLAFGGYHE